MARPNGDLLHEYTLLLDPATSAQGLAATRSRNQQRSATSASESRMPVAPPAAVQGKRYTVASGDTLNGIASRLQGPGNKVSASQLMDGIRSLNPQIFAAGAGSALKVGQDLLLPDAAVLPTAAAPAASAAAPSPKPVELQRTAEQLSAAAIENQQLTQSLEALKAQTQELQEEMSGKDKQIIALRSDLAAAQSAATPTATPAAPATVTPAPATPAVAPAAPAQPVAASGSDSFLSLPILIAAVLIVLLLVAFAYSKRRQQRKESAAPAATPDDQLIKPAQASMLPVFEVPAVAPQPVVQSPSTPAPAKPSPAQRSPGSAPDALDGVSIYIAYGRFTEAMGILRSALKPSPSAMTFVFACWSCWRSRATAAVSFAKNRPRWSMVSTRRPFRTSAIASRNSRLPRSLPGGGRSCRLSRWQPAHCLSINLSQSLSSTCSPSLSQNPPRSWMKARLPR